MNATDLNGKRKELAQRSSSGIEVRLLWNAQDDTLAVTVRDGDAESFELAVAPSEALEVFDHPYAYATTRPRRELAPVG